MHVQLRVLRQLWTGAQALWSAGLTCAHLTDVLERSVNSPSCDHCRELEGPSQLPPCLRFDPMQVMLRLWLSVPSITYCHAGAGLALQWSRCRSGRTRPRLLSSKRTARRRGYGTQELERATATHDIPGDFQAGLHSHGAAYPGIRELGPAAQCRVDRTAQHIVCVQKDDLHHNMKPWFWYANRSRLER